MITISIDVTRLDKARFKEITRRNGDKAKFCELVLIDTPNSDHRDFIVKQGVTKEKREQRIEMPILGNGKVLGKKPQGEHPSRPKPAPPAKRPQADPDLDAPEDSTPF